MNEALEKRGPKTDVGKALVRLNAVQHGILSPSPVVAPFEREEDWAAHREGIVSSLAPSGYFEGSLAERIAQLLWRLNRVVRFETETIATQIEEVTTDWAREEVIRSMLPARARPALGSKAKWLDQHRNGKLVPDASTLERVTRYEAHLHRQLLQTMHELEALQARRRGEKTPLARLDVQGLHEV